MIHSADAGMSPRTGILQSFALQWRALWRTGVLPLCAAASVLVVIAAPHLSRGDGTVAGARHVLVQLALGGAFAVVAIVSLVAACGAFADERAAKRLALTVTRPVPMCGVWLGKFAAIVAAAAVSLAAAMATLFCVADMGGDCVRLMPPVLPTIAEESLAEYDRFMAAPETPAEVKKQPKAAVVKELMKRMGERYDAIRPGETMRWSFMLPDSVTTPGVRLCFAAEFGMRTTVSGTFALSSQSGHDVFDAVVTNLTRSVLDVPLSPTGKCDLRDGGQAVLSFTNTGKGDVMLRPRKDLFITVPGDSAAANAVRTVLMQLVITAVLVALGMFFSSALSKSVSAFSAAVLITVSLMAPAVLVQFPSELGANGITKVGLGVSKAVLKVTRPVGELHPIESFASGECVEWVDIGNAAAQNVLLVPLVLMLLSSAVLVYRPPE